MKKVCPYFVGENPEEVSEDDNNYCGKDGQNCNCPLEPCLCAVKAIEEAVKE